MASMFDAPIPGSNYASDTKNYPWHRPPDITEYDEAVDYMIRKLDDPDEHELVFSLLEIDTQLTTVVSTLLMQGISRGKFPIDLAILMAGPLARYISIVADSQGIKYEVGIEDTDRISITPTALKMALGIIETEDDDLPEEPVEEAASGPDTGGIMGAVSAEEIDPASEDEQAAMLGIVEEEVMEEEPVDGLA